MSNLPGKAFLMAVLRTFGDYPADWPEIARRVKEAAGWRCIRCDVPHGPSPAVLTVHHWDGDKANCRWWNLLALCQRCHLQIQGKVTPDRPWVFEHTSWFRPYVAGYYAWRYVAGYYAWRYRGEGLERAEVEARLDELLALEAAVVIGREPLALSGSPIPIR